MKIRWKELDPLPPEAPGEIQPGLAGPFAGIHGNTLIVAGGANFPGAMPWRGGKKIYHTEIYALNLMPESGSWTSGASVKSLKIAVAYGASASVPAGVVCMGGETDKGFSDSVFIISVAGDTLLVTPLPSLPLPLANAAAAAIGSEVYIAGGISPDGPSNNLFSFDTENITSGWRRLNDMPLALINSVMVAAGVREKDLWILGGRTREAESDTSAIRSEVLRYSVSEDAWYHEGVISDGQDTMGLAAGTGVAADGKNIILFGGNDGTVFNRVEKILSEMAREKDTLRLNEKRSEYIRLQETHPGFSRDVILFDTETRVCTIIGQLPGPTQVTTVAVPTKYGIIIPSGEIRPGIRTPVIMIGRINKKAL